MMVSCAISGKVCNWKEYLDWPSCDDDGDDDFFLLRFGGMIISSFLADPAIYATAAAFAACM